MASFKLTIDCDNDAMQTATDIAAALEKLATQFRRGEFYHNSETSIRDVNGNRVGTYKYEDYSRFSYPYRRDKQTQLTTATKPRPFSGKGFLHRE